MKLLAIETATEACSAALMLGDEISQRYVVQPRGHAQLILPMINELLAESQLSFNALDGVAFGRGPGAFTGVRIAAGVIQGLALGADLPVAPISTLATLAQGAHRETGADQVLAALDARMGEVYWGAYQNSEGIMRLLDEERVCDPLQAPVPADGIWHAAGTGWCAYKEQLESRFSDRISQIEPDRLPQAKDTAVLGASLLKANGGVAAKDALPVYLRDKVASKPV